MHDMDRAAINRMVFHKLSDRAFRQRLTAVAPDGTRPIVAALPSDQLSELIGPIVAVGGGANIVVPWLNGILAFTLFVEHRPDDVPADVDVEGHLGDCTLGVFLARLLVDGGGGRFAYAVTFTDVGGEPTQARAELVAVAG